MFDNTPHTTSQPPYAGAPVGGPAWTPAPMRGGAPAGRRTRSIVVATLVAAALVGGGVLAKGLFLDPGFRLPDEIAGQPRNTRPLATTMVDRRAASFGDDGVERVLGAYGDDEVPRFVLIAERRGRSEADPTGLVLDQVAGNKDAQSFGAIDCIAIRRPESFFAKCVWSTDRTTGSVTTSSDLPLEELAAATEQARTSVES